MSSVKRTTDPVKWFVQHQQLQKWITCFICVIHKNEHPAAFMLWLLSCVSMFVECFRICPASKTVLPACSFLKYLKRKQKKKTPARQIKKKNKPNKTKLWGIETDWVDLAAFRGKHVTIGVHLASDQRKISVSQNIHDSAWMQKFELGAACQKPEECPRKEEQGLRQKTVPEDRIKHPQLF